MITGNEPVPFRAGKLNETIQRPSSVTACGPAEAELVVLVGPGNHREPYCSGHGHLLPAKVIWLDPIAKGVPREFEGRVFDKVEDFWAFFANWKIPVDGPVRIRHMMNAIRHTNEREAI
jgi:hypothetical protein